MATGLKASPAEIFDASTSVVRDSENVDSEISGLERSVKDLVTDNWTGDSSRAFDTTATNEITDLRRFNSVINNLGEAIRKVGDLLTATEEENTNLASSMIDNTNNY